MAFRTPPVSPPQHDYLTGLRRVCSMEFRPHLLNSPDGLADPVLSSAAAPSTSELNILPQSTIYNWSCGHFSRPLLNNSDDNGEASARREERERIAMDCIGKCQRSCTWIGSLFCIEVLLFLKFITYLCFICDGSSSPFSGRPE
jgi:regulator-associated protein of mTOR